MALATAFSSISMEMTWLCGPRAVAIMIEEYPQYAPSSSPRALSGSRPASSLTSGPFSGPTLISQRLRAANSSSTLSTSAGSPGLACRET